MNDGFQKYRRAVRRNLRCTRAVKQRLLARLEQFREDALGGPEGCTYEQAVADFGPPEELARTLTMEVSPEEQQSYRKRRLVRYIIAAVLLLCYLITSTYIIYIKQVTVITATENIREVEVPPEYESEESE